MRIFHPFEWPLLTKLLVTFGLLSFLPLAAIGYYNYTVASQTVLKNQQNALTSRANDMASHLDFLLEERLTIIRHLAGDTSVRNFSAAWPYTTLEQRAAAQDDLDSLTQTNPYFQAIYLMTPDGDVSLSSTDNVGLNFGFRPYFQKALAGETYISEISISVDLKKPVIYFSAPVRDESGQVAAVLVLRVLAEEIWGFIEKEKGVLGAGSEIVLLDEYGIRLAHSSDRELVFKAVVPLDPQIEARLLAEKRLGDMQTIEATDMPDLAAALQNLETQPKFTFQMDGKNETYHAGAARLIKKPWVVVEALPEATFFQPVKNLGRTSIIAITLVLMAVVMASGITTRWIIKPVRELTTSAQRLASGALDQPVINSTRIPRTDEIGQLTSNFEIMRLNLKASYSSLESRNLRLQRLYEMAVKLTGDISDVSDQVVTVIAELLDIRVAAVEEIRGDTINVLSMVASGEIIHEGEYSLQGTPCANVQEKKETCQYTNAMALFPDDRLLAEHHLSAYLGVPILDSKGEVLGVISAMDEQPREFEEIDINLVQTLAKRVGVEIERIRAEDELLRRVGELEAISEVGGLVTAGGDLQSSLDALVSKIARSADFDAVGIGLYDSHKEQVSFPALYTNKPIKLLEERKGKSFRLEDAPVLKMVHEHKQHIYFSDPGNDSRLSTEQRALLQAEGIQAVLIWPLLFGGEVIGGLTLVNTQARDFTPEEFGLLATLADQTATAIRNAQLLEETQQRLHELSLLLELSSALRVHLSRDEMLPPIVTITKKGLDADGVAVFTLDPNSSELTVEAAAGKIEHLQGQSHTLTEMPENCAMRTKGICLGQADCPFLAGHDSPPGVACVPLTVGDQLLGGLHVETHHQAYFDDDGVRMLQGVADIATNALRKAELFDEVLIYSDAFKSSYDGITITDLNLIIRDTNSAIERITGYQREEIIGRKPSLFRSRHSTLPFYKEMWNQIRETGHWTGEIINTRKDGQEWNANLSISAVKDRRNQVISYLGIYRDITVKKQQEREREALLNVAKSLREAAHSTEMLPIIIDQVTNLLNTEDAAIALVDTGSGDIVIEAGHGMGIPAAGVRFPPGTGISGQVIATGEPYVTADVLSDSRLARPDMVEESRAAACVPLISQNDIIGALWIGREKEITDSELNILLGIANMTANALRRATFHEKTRQLASELTSAYDRTLEGWARALELRDEETEGHSKRVTELTVRLARAVGISDEEIIHVRRGALLHDIGKMGIPDSILLKPGKLTEEEWAIMRTHPALACNMLTPIDFLRPALDIPCSHHEKWDGTGYPQGLEGEEIPLPARVFAVIDVWDALSSDRPYRGAWPEEKVLSYLQDQTGTHFDPRIVDAFLKLPKKLE